MRDYKGSTSRSQGPQRRRPAAVRKQPSKTASSSGGPRWLVAGLAAGLLVALLVFLNGRKDQPQPDLRLSEDTPAQEAPPRPAPPRAAKPAPSVAKPTDPQALALLEEPLPPPRPQSAASAPAPAPVAPGSAAPPTAASRSAPAANPAKPAKPAKREPQEAKYQFYDLLPRMEVEVSPDALDNSQAESHPAQGAAEGAAPQSNPAPATQLAPGEFFVIQAGSFRNPAEAQAMSAKMALLGLRTEVKSVDIPGQGKWYRLRSEPYHDAQSASEALQAAQASGAKVLLIKTR